MARIFFTLSSFATLLVLGNLLLGHFLFGYGDTAREYINTSDKLAKQEKGNADQSNNEKLAEKQRKLLQRFVPMKKRMVLHFWIGIGAALVTILVNSVSITYFIGTNRWCREVTEMYRLEESFCAKSDRLKRRSFPWAFGGILTAIVLASLGASADPSGYLRANAANWVIPHYMFALLGSLLIPCSFLIQVGAIGANYAVIEDVVAEVDRIRTERGLEPSKLADGAG